jgi:hypothetical protein
VPLAYVAVYCRSASSIFTCGLTLSGLRYHLPRRFIYYSPHPVKDDIHLIPGILAIYATITVPSCIFPVANSPPSCSPTSTAALSPDSGCFKHSQPAFPMLRSQYSRFGGMIHTYINLSHGLICWSMHYWRFMYSCTAIVFALEVTKSSSLTPSCHATMSTLYRSTQQQQDFCIGLRARSVDCG